MPSRTTGQKTQPLEVLHFVCAAVAARGPLMSVIGSEDKKSRLATKRFFYLCEWHAQVPALVRAFQNGPELFHAMVAKVPGLRGELSSKELYIFVAVAKNNSVARVGRFSLLFGQGVKNGTKTFLKVPLKAGRASAAYYKDHLAKLCPKLEKTIGKLYPQLPAKLKKVDIFDIEPALCGAFIYAKQAA